MLNHIFISVMVSLAIIPMACSAQMNKLAAKKYQRSTELIKNGETEKAVDHLLEISNENPDIYDVQYRLGWQLLKLDRKTQALHHFGLAFDLTEKPDPKLVTILVNLYEENDHYDKAITAMNRFMASIDSQDKLWDFSQRRRSELEFRKQAYANPLDIQLVLLDTVINTDASEYLPAFNARGTEFIFTRNHRKVQDNFGLGGNQEDLYSAKLDSQGNFICVKPIDELNTQENEGAHCFSQDGNILIFTSCNRGRDRGGCDLYISFRRNGKWSSPINMGPKINTRYWESQPALSPDNRTLYFSSTRKGGFGKADIWKVELQGKSWSDPVNLGPVINTSGNEGSPFLHADNQTLYFRSDEHIGLGDFDLFMARRDTSGWQVPVNLGYPINSTSSEGALFVDLNGNRAYYTSNQHSEKNDFDILYFELPEQFRPQAVSYVHFTVIDKVSRQKINASIVLKAVDRAEDIVMLSTNDGEALHVIQQGNYMVTVSKDNYLFYSENIPLLDMRDFNKPFEFIIELQAIPTADQKQSEAVILKNIFFESASSTLLQKSIYEIEKLYALLKDNPSISISIIGHTDNIGSEEDNLKLSKKRADAVRQVLLDMGIEENRIMTEGKGEQIPIADNSTEEGRSLNRRTEFVVNNPGT